MKKCTQLATGLGMVAMLAASSAAVAQPSPKTAEKSAAAPAGPPEELKVLTPFVGQWTSESVIRPNLRNKEGFTSKGDMTWQWMHNGHFLGLTGVSKSKLGTFESTAVIWYDRGRKQFRQFAFSSDGTAAHSVGEWNEKTQTMTWKGVDLPDGWTTTSTVTLDRDRIVFAALAKNEKGEVLRDVSSTSKRNIAVERGSSSEPAKEPAKKK